MTDLEFTLTAANRKLQAKVDRLEDELRTIKRKRDIQRSEIGRLTQALDKCAEEKRKAVSEIKWMRGEAA